MQIHKNVVLHHMRKHRSAITMDMKRLICEQLEYLRACSISNAACHTVAQFQVKHLHKSRKWKTQVAPEEEPYVIFVCGST